MLEAWTGEVKARCHVAQIKMKELADECGYNPAYLSEVINGRTGPRDGTRDRIFAALDRKEDAQDSLLSALKVKVKSAREAVQ